MNRTSVALLAALEAVLTVAIGIAVALVPLTLLWAVQYGFAVDWLVFWRAAVDSWLLGNGVNLLVSLPADLAARLGIVGASTPFFVTIAPLGFAVITVFMGFRAGRRSVRADRWITGAITSIVVFGILSVVATFSALNEIARPSLVQGGLLPPLVYALGLAVGVLAQRAEEGHAFDLPAVADRLASHHRALIGAAARGGAAAAAAIVGVAAALLGLLILLNFGVITGLYEASQPTVVGVTMTTLAQLAFIPNAVIWVASWLIGPGFALGAGTSVSPVNTLLGPVPAVPLLGAVPTGDFAFGFVGLIVPMLAGFIAATIMRRRLVVALEGRSIMGWLGLAALGIGLVAGILMGLLAWFSQGAAGPGRLVDVGPAPLLVGLFAALEVTIAAAIAMASGSHQRADAPAVDPHRLASQTNDPQP